MHFHNLAPLALGLVSLFGMTQGQIYNRHKAKDLAKRSGTVNFNPNCNAAPPTQSGYGSRFPTMQSILQQAYNDAVALANQASVIQQTSPALASTDATIGTATDNKVINICPLFFTAAQTRYFLYDPNQGPNPGRPYRDNSGAGWCHTILHELTHLDSLGAVAELEPPTEGPDAGRHGTEDLQPGFGLSGARDYKQIWEDSGSDLNSPDYNAESYAATATEFFFMNVCGFQEIPQ
ncbi:hypothetical protein P7C71_g5211, partial [Lecanoromycetidae sp. Uapishka_2]